MEDQAVKDGVRTVLLHSPDEVTLDVHQVMPSLTAEEFSGLKEDIRENGILYPIFLDEDYNIIDGHNRVLCWKHLLLEGVDPAPVAAHVFPEMDKYKAHDLAIAVNVKRRHLSPEQKRELVRSHLIHLAERYESQGFTGGNARSWSTTRIAEYLAVSQGIVRDERNKLEKQQVIPWAPNLVIKSSHPNGTVYEQIQPRQYLADKGKKHARNFAEYRSASSAEEALPDIDDSAITLTDGTKIALPDVEQIVNSYRKQAVSAVEETQLERTKGNGKVGVSGDPEPGAIEVLKDAGINIPDPPQGKTHEEKVYAELARFRDSLRAKPSDPKMVARSIADRPLQVAATVDDFGELARWLTEFHEELVAINQEVVERVS